MNYDQRLINLRARKLQQTRDKIEQEGLLDEDDYGRIVPPKGVWQIRPNHADGSFYGYDAWADNFCSLMAVHPVYVDPDDAFAGRWMYFMSKMRPNKWNPAYPYDHLKGNIALYNIICGIGDDAHFAPDYQMGLELGWGGLLDKIAACRRINTAPEQQHFYDLHERVIRSIQGWITRHIVEAERLAAEEPDAERRDNLLAMAETNRAIVNQPPKSLREACQWIVWYHLASRTYNRDGAGGQIDALLRPYYERDVRRGMTDDEAVYYLACLLINDPVYWQLGGPDENGKDQTSHISFLILEAAAKINTSLNITIRVHDGLDRTLLRTAVSYLIQYKNGWPRFSGDKALVEGFMRNGYSAELARRRIAVGCNWMSLPGLEYTMNDLVKVNMAKVFEVAYEEMLATDEAPSTDLLWQKFEHHLGVAVHTAAEGIRHHLKYQKFNEPELLLNLLSHGPLERGRDASDGGAQYYNLAIDGAGLAVVADSFAALEQRVEQEQRMSWSEIDRHLRENFEGEGGLIARKLLQSASRYGQEDSLGERWALRVRDAFVRNVRRESEPEQNRIFIPGFFSWANTVEFGLAVKATPNGRKSGTPISHGANPLPGFAQDDASLSLATCIARIQPGYGNTAPMQWEIDPSFARQDNAELIEAILRAHFKMGGTLVNVNVMDKQTVLAAYENPDDYPELVVRVTGFTAYFSMLSPRFRQLVVERILES